MQMEKRLRGIAAAVLLMMILVVVFPALAGDYPVAVINTADPAHCLDLRAAARSSAESLGQYYNGVIVVVKDRSDATWWKVEVVGRAGYMEAASLTLCGLQSGYDQAVLDRVVNYQPKAVVGGQSAQDGLHLRDRPSTSANSLGKFYNGTAVTILGSVDNGTWYQVYLPETEQWGFLLGKYVQVTQTDPVLTGDELPDSTGIYAVVDNSSAYDRLNLRAEASDTSASLGRFYNGTTVEILGEEDGWCRVKVDGITGYMMAEYLRKDSDTKTLVKLDVGRNDGGGLPLPTLRSAPSDNASAVTIPDPGLGGSLDILGKAGTWYYVQIQGARGYYPANRVTPGARNSSAKHIAVVTGENLRERLNLRASASEASASLGKYFVGTQVEVLDDAPASTDSSTWYKVLVDGKEGYMDTKYLVNLQTGDPSTW